MGVLCAVYANQVLLKTVHYWECFPLPARGWVFVRLLRVGEYRARVVMQVLPGPEDSGCPEASQAVISPVLLQK